VLVGLIGTLVLACAVFDIEVLRSAFPRWPEMKASTALTFLLMALSLLLLARPHTVPWQRIVRRVAAGLALLVAVLTLLDYAADLNLDIDLLLIHDVVEAGGRMPPVTALGLATGAAAFLLLDVGRTGALAQILAIAAGTLGFLNLVGFAYSLHSAGELAGYPAVALHTAVGLVLLGSGILFARPERGLVRMAVADTPAGVVVRRLLPAVVVAPFLLGWFIEAGRQAGLYGPEFSMALSVVGTVGAFSAVVWLAAAALQRADIRRRRAETALHRADAEVGRVVARTVELTDANKALVELAARLRTLNLLNRLVSSSLDFEAVLVAIARAASDITATPVVSFWLVDDRARTVTVRAWSDATVGADFPSASFAFGEGAVGRVASTREPVHVPDVFESGADIRSLGWCRAHDLRSFYGVPVLAQDRLLAVLALSRRTPLDLGEDEQELLGSFVAQAAVAIDNARLFAEAEARRRAAETAEARYRELFDRNLAGIFRTTLDGRPLDCNEALVRILGYRTREEVLALRLPDVAIDRASYADIVFPRRAGERLSNVEMRWRRADGAPIAVLVNVAAIETEAGLMLEGIIVDITDRERAAAAEREAEALRAVAKLANAAAHEINNPLAVIVGHLDLLDRKYEHDPDTSQRLDRARQACHRIAQMIVHMGRITRLEESEDQSPNLPPILDLRRSSEADPS
jgi:PAS domain S-box-containing protein